MFLPDDCFFSRIKRLAKIYTQVYVNVIDGNLAAKILLCIGFEGGCVMLFVQLVSLSFLELDRVQSLVNPSSDTGQIHFGTVSMTNAQDMIKGIESSIDSAHGPAIIRDTQTSVGMALRSTTALLDRNMIQTAS